MFWLTPDKPSGNKEPYDRRLLIPFYRFHANTFDPYLCCGDNFGSLSQLLDNDATTSLVWAWKCHSDDRQSQHRHILHKVAPTLVVVEFLCP
jgi:hypothetical protein